MKVISPWDMVESKVSNEFSTAKIQLTMKFSRVTVKRNRNGPGLAAVSQLQELL